MILKKIKKAQKNHRSLRITSRFTLCITFFAFHYAVASTDTASIHTASTTTISTKNTTQVAANSIKETISKKSSSNTLSNHVVHYLPFHIETNEIKLSGSDNFIFSENDFIAIYPLAKPLESNLAKTVAYLNGNPFHQLTITGRYQLSENNRSTLADLGLARANYIKDYLLFLGANKQQISIDSKSYPKAVSNTEKQYLGMANFSIKSIKDNTLKNKQLILKNLSDEIRANPLILYFKTGTKDIRLTKKQQERLSTISQYLDFSREAKIIITGHTDSTGNREKNIQLGLGRAEFAAKYLEKNGLNQEQMVIQSKGPDSPIADNKTKQGRSKNRRVVITVSKTNINNQTTP